MEMLKKNLRYTPVVSLLLVTLLRLWTLLRSGGILYLLKFPISLVLNLCPVILLVLLILREKFKDGRTVYAVAALALGALSLSNLSFSWAGAEFIDLIVYGMLLQSVVSILTIIALISTGACLLAKKDTPKLVNAIIIVGVAVCTLCALFMGIVNPFNVVTGFVTGALYVYALWSAKDMFDEQTIVKRKLTGGKVKGMAFLFVIMFVCLVMGTSSSGGSGSGTSGSGSSGQSYGSVSDYIKQQDPDLYNTIVNRYESLTK